MYSILVWISALILSVAAFGTQAKDPCDFAGTTVAAAGDLDLAKKVETIFAASCAKCHGNGATGGAFVMTNILNRDELLRDGMIDLADPPASRIVGAINRKVRPMPLGGTPLADADKDLILNWIKSGAPDWEPSIDKNDPILTHKQEWECANWDLKKNVKEKSRYYTRYLSFGHLKGVDFTAARDGAIKWVNNLHKRNKAVAPLAVDKFGKILRVDLRHYEPNLDVNAWEKLVVAGYPYAYEPEDYLLAFYVRELNASTYSARGMVRGDFFISKTSQGDAYYSILRAQNTLQEFERYLGLDTDKDLLGAYAKRGSLAKSGVTNYPRLVDRFDLNLYSEGQTTSGAHWITRDFNSDKGTSNIYAFPFGPRILACYNSYDEARFFAEKVFENQAGESITSLPNGFQQYGIWDGKGKRLNKADPHIAVERSGLFDDQSVQTAISCNYCHAGGINPFDDDSVIRHVRAAASFTVEEVKFAEDLFFTKDQRAKAFADHATAFKNAMNSLGLNDPQYLTPGGEPVTKAFRKFEGYLTCVDLAWELGISKVELQNYLHHSVDLAREAGLADCDSGKLSRTNYVHLFPKFIKAFNIGTAVKIGAANPYVPPVQKCKVTLTNRTKYWVGFQVSYDGVADNLRWNPNVSKSWETNSAGSLTYGRNSWSLVACKNHSFQYRNGYVSLYQE